MNLIARGEKILLGYGCVSALQPAMLLWNVELQLLGILMLFRCGHFGLSFMK